jgi:acetoin utilization deacetylase AcuC-like enzyme
MDQLVLFYPTNHAAHAERGHPERPQRVEVMRAALETAGWWEQYPQLAPLTLSESVLHTIHSPTYLNILQRVCARGEHYDADTYTTPASWQLARAAAEGAAAVAQAVWRGRACRGFALTRPPGHHAIRSAAMGFCLLNNIALTAEYLIQQEGAQRLAIIDLDLHHGNGTQEAFYKRGDVFYFSTHQYPFYPGSGDLNEKGAGPGEGTTANFPLPPFSGDRAFRAVMDEVILPLLDRFLPQMILVSYGFDTHWRDPLGQLQLSAAAYGELIACLTHWADEHCAGRIVLLLEGGYDLEAAQACTLAVTAALLGEPFDDVLGFSPYPEGMYWQSMVRQARQIWQT